MKTKKFIRETLGGCVNSHLIIPAEGTAGGMILAWKDQYFTKVDCRVEIGRASCRERVLAIV